MTNDAVFNVTLATVAEQILHEDFRPQVGEGKARPFDVALDKLMPRMVRDPGIVIPTGAEMDDVLYPGSLRRVQEILALPKPIDPPRLEPWYPPDRDRETTGIPRCAAFSGERPAAMTSTDGSAVRYGMTPLPTRPVAPVSKIFGLLVISKSSGLRPHSRVGMFGQHAFGDPTKLPLRQRKDRRGPPNLSVLPRRNDE